MPLYICTHAAGICVSSPPRVNEFLEEAEEGPKYTLERCGAQRGATIELGGSSAGLGQCEHAELNLRRA